MRAVPAVPGLATRRKCACGSSYNYSWGGTSEGQILGVWRVAVNLDIFKIFKTKVSEATPRPMLKTGAWGTLALWLLDEVQIDGGVWDFSVCGARGRNVGAYHVEFRGA
jgi:hypothetical protein